MKIDLTPEGLSINIFDRAHKPIFNPNTDMFTDYGAWVFSTLAWEISRYTTFHLELEGHTESNRKPAAKTTANGICPPSAPTPPGASSWTMAWPTAQIVKVSGFADTAPMPDYAPTERNQPPRDRPA